MKLVNNLNIKGAVLDRHQLNTYLEQIASDHILQNKSIKGTYPIPRLEKNFEFITKTYAILTEHLKMGFSVHPAGEWLLDNYYIIEESYQEIKKNLPLKKYINFPGLANGMYKGYSRLFVLASEMIAYTDGKIEEDNLKEMLNSYQKKKTLNMEEIWNIGLFFQIALIEKIRGICEKIYYSQIQKYKAENIIERLVEKKTGEKIVFKMHDKYIEKYNHIEQMKYPFIEHLSYKLKKYGKQANPYLEILEEQVNRLGMTVSEVVQKEHFDIAFRKVSIGNCIKSIKEIKTMNLLEIFEEINGVEDILKQDPSGVYINMDYKTKEYYRQMIKYIGEKTKISEIYIAKKILNIAKSKTQEKERHIGYYLIDKGIYELIKKLEIKKKSIEKSIIKKIELKSINAYLFSILGVSALFSFIYAFNLYKNTGNVLIAICTFLLIYIPETEILTQFVQYLLGKIIKPKIVPKMDYLNGIPEDKSTMVVIPTIINSEEKAKELTKKLEVFYLANKSENIYFALLGDCTLESKEEVELDKKIEKIALEEIEKLNIKYKSVFPKFHFIYRQRQWIDGEEAFLGWERKRGLLTQFNEYIVNAVNEKKENFSMPFGKEFRVNTLKSIKKDFPKIKYIITLDADTDLVLNSGLELVGAMSHILNKPILNKEKTVVIEGHALMQPRVGIHLEETFKSKFSKIFAGMGGTDSYTNAISDTYQDNFGEGIFTGKGIYDLAIFREILSDSIPENTVLSHDLLEGSYLRCALVSDIMFMDGYPSKYNSFSNRLHRWIRGDWQIISWLKKNIKNKNNEIKKNPLNKLSKFKIIDNLRRSIIEISLIFLFVFAVILNLVNTKIKIGVLFLKVLITIFVPVILDFINLVIFKEDGKKKQKTFEKNISGISASIIRCIIIYATFPYKAYLSIDAIIRTIYRLKVSKKHLLEWTTSEEAEKSAKEDCFSYYRQMFFNLCFGIVAVITGLFVKNIILKIVLYLSGLMWIFAPYLMQQISKEEKQYDNKESLSKSEKDYILDIAKNTWNFFNTYMTEENNFLPPDNYQEDRKFKIVDRTSSTNIGLSLLCIVSAYDLGWIEKELAINKIKSVLYTIEKMPKWNGHLYNWYNIKTLQPLIPKYISTVDSGNFIGYLYTLKQFLVSLQETNLVELVDKLINDTDFKVLYDEKKKLFSIGYDLEENKLTNSYYDLLASEARQASFVAIAKKDISSKHWGNLSRALTSIGKYKGLISWSGTAFEYLMPNINMRHYNGSLLDESSKFLIMSQEKYAEELGIPWGISETAFYLKDLNGNYQYKAFGIPWLGLKRGLADEIVVSPYASILAINEVPKKVVDNLKKLDNLGMKGRFGLYESIDFTPYRVMQNFKGMPVKTYMAHHQALILLSINNLFNKNIFEKRFMENPEIKAIDILLQERLPENMIITKNQ